MRRVRALGIAAVIGLTPGVGAANPLDAAGDSAAVVAAQAARTALHEPARLEAWVRLHQALRAMRPDAPGGAPAPAERAAFLHAAAVASVTPGALTDLSVRSAGSRTEILVRATGDVRYRLFRRLADPVDPRLTLEILDARPGLLDARYPGIDRGGVRELRVTPTDSGTVQVAVALAEPTEFGFEARDDALVIWIANGGAAFATWHSRPEWARNLGAPAGTDASAAARAEALMPSAMPSSVAPAIALVDEVLASARPIGAQAAAEPAGSSADPPLPGPLDDRVTDAWFRSLPVDDAVELARRVLVDPLTPLILALATLGGAALLWRGRGTGRAVAPGRVPRSAPRPRRGTRGDASAVWTVLALAEHGTSDVEIARRTGWSRDAIALVRRRPPARGDAAKSSDPGRVFRVGAPAGSLAGKAVQ